MSDSPGYTLEAFVKWNYRLYLKERDGDTLRILEENTGSLERYPVITEEQFRQLIAIWEPAREQIEDMLDRFDEQEYGWRHYFSGYGY